MYRCVASRTIFLTTLESGMTGTNYSAILLVSAKCPCANVGAIADKPIMEIVIHGTTALKANSKLSHPVVRVTIVDSESGRLYPKLHP